MNLLGDAHIHRIYAQGAEAICRLVHRLEDWMANMERQLIRSPQPVISRLSQELATAKRSLARKTDEIIRERQLNHQLQRRIRELEREVERATSPPERDSPL